MAERLEIRLKLTALIAQFEFVATTCPTRRTLWRTRSFCLGMPQIPQEELQVWLRRVSGVAAWPYATKDNGWMTVG